MFDSYTLKKVGFYILITLLLITMITPVCAMPSPPEVSGDSAVLLDYDRGQILFEKNSKKMTHASIMCKLMTALVAIENTSLDSKVTISKQSSKLEGSLLSLEAGEKYTVEDLLYATMLTSANDAANSLAEFIGGDMEKFVDMMNKKAQELKLADTNFKNPTGLFDEGQYTTANDFAVFIRYATANPNFQKFFTARAKPWISKSGTQMLVNQNKLFWSYDGVDGGKTGYNEKSQQSSVTTAVRNGQKLVSIVLDSPEEQIWDDSMKLFDYGFTNFMTGRLVLKNQPLKDIMVGDKKVNLISLSDVFYTFPIGEDYIKSLEFNISRNLVPPITKDQTLGTARYTLNDNTVIEVSLYPDTEIIPPKDFITIFTDKLFEHKDILYLIIFLLFIELMLMIYHLRRFIKYKMLKKKEL